MKKQLYAVIAFLFSGILLTAPPLMAQNKTGDSSQAYNEIIIRQKGMPQDVTIQLKGDEVWINGKKLPGGGDSSITVMRRKIPLLDGNLAFNNFGNHRSFNSFRNFRNNDQWNVTGNKALLGVVTEKDSSGARITMVSDNSAAQKSGLKTGDVIKKVDDHTVQTPQDLADIIGNYNPGDNITITYERNNEKHTTKAVLGKNENNAMDLFGVIPRNGNEYHFRIMPPMNGNDFFHQFNNNNNEPKLGITIQDTEKGNGVKVLKVQPNSAAAKAGIQQNDIITSYGDNNVSNVNEMMQAIQDEKDSHRATVKVQRNNKTETLQLTIPKKLHTMDL